MSARYRCTLSSDLADWLDQEIWREVGGSEFCEPVPPEDLLNDAPAAIWPGLMPCDLLPVLGNASGDWLCVRIDSRSHASEIVHWYHGGGDWLPWGRSLAQAILFDSLFEQLPSPSRRHAVPAEPSERSLAMSKDPLIRWARGHVDAEVADLIDHPVPPEQVAEVLLQQGIAEIAVRCELVQSALKETLSATLDPATAQRLGVDWNQVVQWMFDVQTMPEATRKRLESEYGLSISKPQDWQSAEHHSRLVIAQTPELAWAWDVVGYSAERAGQPDAAIDAYRRAARCSGFTDQSVRLRTHWTASHAAKFSASRLQERFPEVVEQSDYLQLLCEPDVNSRRQRVTQYWIEQATAAAASGDWDEARGRYFAAGWDLGAEPLSAYAELLDRIGEAADRCDQPGRAELARTHRRCLKDRYDL